MIKKYFPILILSAICLAACSKKEDNEIPADENAPVMSVVNEVPAEEAQEPQEPLRDPLKNIVTATDNNTVADTTQNQNLAGDIPPGYKAETPVSPAQAAHFENPMGRILTDRQPAGAQQPSQPSQPAPAAGQ